MRSYRGAMARAIDRRTMARWLVDHGFERVPGNGSGILKFRRPGCGSIIVAGHGSADMYKKFVNTTLRILTTMGFDADEVRAELNAGKWKGCTLDSHRLTVNAAV